MTSSLRDRVDAVIDTAIRDKRIVGTVTLVAENGEVIYRRAAGFSDREAGRAMREDQLFRLSSVTKPVVSAAVMALLRRRCPWAERRSTGSSFISRRSTC